ncbi:hypothetical protein, partial [Streptomyces angustmyceticus]
MQNIRKRIPHVIGASVLAVTLTGTLGAISAVGADASSASSAKSKAQVSKQVPDVRCRSVFVNRRTGRLVKFPPNCVLGRIGGGIGSVTTGATTTGATTTTTGSTSTTGATTTGATTTTTGATSTTGATTTG